MMASGFVADGGGGMGLKGMRERLAALDGELRLGARPVAARGWRQ